MPILLLPSMSTSKIRVGNSTSYIVRNPFSDSMKRKDWHNARPTDRHIEGHRRMFEAQSGNVDSNKVTFPTITRINGAKITFGVDNLRFRDEVRYLMITLHLDTLSLKSRAQLNITVTSNIFDGKETSQTIWEWPFYYHGYAIATNRSRFLQGVKEVTFQINVHTSQRSHANYESYKPLGKVKILIDKIIKNAVLSIYLRSCRAVSDPILRIWPFVSGMERYGDQDVYSFKRTGSLQVIQPQNQTFSPNCSFLAPFSLFYIETGRSAWQSYVFETFCTNDVTGAHLLGFHTGCRNDSNWALNLDRHSDRTDNMDAYLPQTNSPKNRSRSFMLRLL